MIPPKSFEVNMKTIERKEGNKTIIKIVPDDYEETHDTKQRDLTTGGATLLSLGIDKNEYDRIFKKENTKTNRENIAVQSQTDKKR